MLRAAPLLWIPLAVSATVTSTVTVTVTVTVTITITVTVTVTVTTITIIIIIIIVTITVIVTTTTTTSHLGLLHKLAWFSVGVQVFGAVTPFLMLDELLIGECACERGAARVCVRGAWR